MALPTDLKVLERAWVQSKSTLSEPAKSDFQAFVAMVDGMREREEMYIAQVNGSPAAGANTNYKGKAKLTNTMKNL